ncbi:hypothetical protein APA_2431 [Pseudanabaena sp. lw0831]|nr:hypothetical protein APA_2431 [Pseudanabaena sp. lw0831]
MTHLTQSEDLPSPLTHSPAGEWVKSHIIFLFLSPAGEGLGVRALVNFYIT